MPFRDIRRGLEFTVDPADGGCGSVDLWVNVGSLLLFTRNGIDGYIASAAAVP